jgi:hypothetical protein
VAEPFVPGRYVSGRGNKNWKNVLRAAENAPELEFPKLPDVTSKSTPANATVSSSSGKADIKTKQKSKTISTYVPTPTTSGKAGTKTKLPPKPKPPAPRRTTNARDHLVEILRMTAFIKQPKKMPGEIKFKLPAKLHVTLAESLKKQVASMAPKIYRYRGLENVGMGEEIADEEHVYMRYDIDDEFLNRQGVEIGTQFNSADTHRGGAQPGLVSLEMASDWSESEI